jgi:hypothetical protein
MLALANLYSLVDVPVQQLAMGLAIFPLLVAVARTQINRRRLSCAYPEVRPPRMAA